MVDWVKHKQRLRVEAKAKRAALSENERGEFAARAHSALLASEAWANAGGVGLFCSMGDEIDTWALLTAAWDSERRVALPFTPPLGEPLEFKWATRESVLVPSSYGVLEPGPEAPVAAVAELDLLVVPGLAFDARGARLGYGGGYYDRTIEDSASSVMLAYECQRVDQVPEGPHDRRVDAVVTERGWMQAGVAGD